MKAPGGRIIASPKRTTNAFFDISPREPICDGTALTDAWDQAAVATSDRALRFQVKLGRSAGSIALSWLPVSTMKSDGPDWLILRNHEQGPATSRGLRPSMLLGSVFLPALRWM